MGRGCNLCEGPGRQTRFEITPWEENVHVATDLDALIRLVWAGKVEIILASNLNGLARSSWELVALLREFVSRKITLIIPNQRIDTSKVPRQAFLGMLDAIEEFKLSATVESIRAGLAAARKRGARLGRPQTVNPHRGDVARLRARGMTGRAIAKELGIPSSTAFKLIKGREGFPPRKCPTLCVGLT